MSLDLRVHTSSPLLKLMEEKFDYCFRSAISLTDHDVSVSLILSLVL